MPDLGPFAVLDHLLNFIAPAAFLALVLAWAGRWVTGRAGPGPGFVRTATVLFLIGLLVLAGGLFVWGRDGKMATYAALVGILALVRWLMARGWRRWAPPGWRARLSRGRTGRPGP